MSRKYRIAVVGAGMGGLLAAAMLQRAGHACTVYEQAPRLAKVGAGINVGPNSTRLFRALGLEERMLNAGIQPRLKFSRDWQTGDVLYIVPVPELRERYGAPFLAFHRGALQDVLYGCLEPDSVQFGRRLAGLTQTPDQVRLDFSDGSSAEADIVIGADGVHSRVRESLFGAAPADYYGLVAHRALIVGSGLQPADNTKWWAPDRYVLVYYTTEARDEINLVTGSPRPWTGDYQPRQTTREDLLETFGGFHEEVQQVLRAATSISCWPMLERTPFSPWSQGRVVLIGDACHPTTPHMGQGAGMAFEDAVVLARCIDEFGADPTQAFGRYEQARHARTSRIQRESHENEWTKKGMDPDWVYGYDALTVPI